MFKFPFGTMQELNLDWIINKIREFAETGTKTKEPLKFTFSDGTEQTFDGEEAVTIDLAGSDISGKLDKYTGGVDTLYATIGANQTNLPLPLNAQYGGTGVTSLAALKTALGLALEYVARRTTAGRWVYTHEAGVDGEKALSYTPDIDTIPCRTANSTVQTAAPQADDDAVNRKYFDDNAEKLTNKDSAIVAADESSTTKYPSIKGIIDWIHNNFFNSGNFGDKVLFHDNTQEIGNALSPYYTTYNLFACRFKEYMFYESVIGYSNLQYTITGNKISLLSLGSTAPGSTIYMTPISKNKTRNAGVYQNRTAYLSSLTLDDVKIPITPLLVNANRTETDTRPAFLMTFSKTTSAFDFNFVLTLLDASNNVIETKNAPSTSSIALFYLSDTEYRNTAITHFVFTLETAIGSMPDLPIDCAIDYTRIYMPFTP